MVVYHSDARNNTNLPNNLIQNEKYNCNAIAISNYNIAKSPHSICIHLWDTK